MIIQAIENSFLLNQNEKEYLITSIQDKSESFINWLLEILQNEKIFLLQLLRQYKNKNVEIWIIKQEIRLENMKRIRELEKLEKENMDEKTFFQNI